MNGDRGLVYPRLLISAYAASPAHTRWDPALEAELLPALCALPAVAGLEVPWLGALHPHDSAWFLRNLPSGAQLSLTALPWVMQRCATMPGYGLASRAPEGRAAALADMKLLNADLHTIGQHSPAEVAFVALHSAPRGTGDRDALASSLDELSRWDWGAAHLIVEHCDAVREGQPYEKGFLSLRDEIDALERSSSSAGLWMNWGRSAIEVRNADAVTEQIARAAGSGRLAGLTFSGAATADGPYGAAWTDTHPPIAETDPSSRSLLDTAHVADAIAAAGDVAWLGLKVSRRPADRNATDVASTVARNLSIILGALDSASDRPEQPATLSAQAGNRELSG